MMVSICSILTAFHQVGRARAFARPTQSKSSNRPAHTAAAAVAFARPPRRRAANQTLPPPPPHNHDANQKTALPTLPNGQGPLYTSADAMTKHLERWARTNPRAFRLLSGDATDPRTGQSLLLAEFTAADDDDGSANNATSAAFSFLPRERRARAFVTCGIHAREIITVDACFALLRLLAPPEGDGAAGAESGGGGNDGDALALLAWPEMRRALGAAGLIGPDAARSAGRALPAVRAMARRLAATTVLTVMPLLNPSGRAAIEERGAFALRVNERGVDLNRNFPSNWLPPSPGQQAGDDTYPGAEAASEWQTRAVSAATAKRGVDSFVDLHSGFVSLMGPAAASACGLRQVMTRGSARAHGRAMRAMARSMPSPTVAGPVARVLYAAAGTTLDDALSNRGAAVAVAVEVYDSDFSTRAGYACPSYEAFWAAPCAQEPGGAEAAAAGTRCVELPPPPPAEGGRSGMAAKSAPPRVPDGELMWHEIADARKLRELAARHGVDASPGGALERLAAGGPDGDGGGGGGAAERLVANATAATGNPPGLLPERAVPAEAWWRDDPVLRHASGDWSDGRWRYLTTFNPTGAGEFRDVVSRWVAALLSFAFDAERQ